MQFPGKITDRFLRLQILLKSLWHHLGGTLPVSFSKISKELIRECVGREDPTILEIGCNDGSQTLWFLEIFEKPKVYCFEPDPRAVARFKAKVGRRSNINIFEIALSDHIGEATFFQSDGQLNEEQAKAMPEGWDLSGSIRQPKEHLAIHPWVTFDKKTTVKTSTLDAWCDKQGIEAIDFIWMDVQGAEIDVLRGGKNTLTKTRFIYTEYSNNELYKGQFNLRQLIKYLQDFDFGALIKYPEDILFGSKQLAGAPNKALKKMLVDLYR